MTLGVKSIGTATQLFFHPAKQPLWEFLYHSGLTLLFGLIIPIASIVSGIGLFRQKKWGWILALAVSLIVFTQACSRTINFAIVSYFFSAISISDPSQDTPFKILGMIPTYITTFTSLAFIAILNRESVKNLII